MGTTTMQQRRRITVQILLPCIVVLLPMFALAVRACFRTVKRTPPARALERCLRGGAWPGRACPRAAASSIQSFNAFELPSLLSTE